MTETNARIVTVAGKRCRILLDGKSELNATLRGKFFVGEFSGVVTGDTVWAEESGGQWMVEAMAPRRNEFVREGLRKERQVLFANVDRVLILASLNTPRTKEAAFDRFLVAALRGGIPPVLVLSKTDLDTNGAREAELRGLYSAFDFPVHAVSAETGCGTEALLNEIASGSTALVGNSGVGKTTLINQLIPGLDLRTREISAWSGKGTHTTTAALLIPFSVPRPSSAPPASSLVPHPLSFLLDTPGIKSFVPYGITSGNLIELFPDLSELTTACRFNNCHHSQEPGCAILQAVETGAVAPSRLRSYHRLLSELTAEFR